MKNLTASPTAVVAVSGRASKARVDGGYDWRERKKAWVREIRATVDQNDELMVHTAPVSDGGSPRGVGDGVWAQERWIEGRR